jgi:hypothetical protein
MPWLPHLARSAFLSLLIYPVVAPGQTPSPAPSAPPEVKPLPPTGPSFQSGGIKATVTSLAGQASRVALSLLLENKTKESLLVAIVGPPIGVNGGNAYSPDAIGGIASCIYNPHNLPVKTLDRATEISGCLKGDQPQLTADTFTLIEAGNAVPMNVAFASPYSLDLNKDFSFSMNVAVFKESDLSASDSGGSSLTTKGHTATLPPSLRYISVGIPSLPLNQR